MKKIIFVTLTSFLFNTGNAQVNKVNAAASKSNQHLKVFNQAVISGDINTGIMALNYYINEQGVNTVYADTLAMLYMQNNSYVQCYYWADKRLKLKPDDLALMEMKGICLDKLQKPKEAIAIFEKLYAAVISQAANNPIKKKVFAVGLAVGKRYSNYLRMNKSVPLNSKRNVSSH